MDRITISIPEELALRLREEARRRGVAVSELARGAIEGCLRELSEPEAKLSFAGIGRSGERHVGRDSEEILDKKWGKLAQRR